MNRIKLDDTRMARVHKFKVGNATGYVRVGLFQDGRPGEIFINMSKSRDNGPWGCIGILVSMALQRGVPLRDIVRKLSYTRFEPMGFTKNDKIHSATSVMDYIVRWLWLEFGDDTDPSKDPPSTESNVAEPLGAT